MLFGLSHLRRQKGMGGKKEQKKKKKLLFFYFTENRSLKCKLFNMHFTVTFSEWRRPRNKQIATREKKAASISI